MHTKSNFTKFIEFITKQQLDKVIDFLNKVTHRVDVRPTLSCYRSHC